MAASPTRGWAADAGAVAHVIAPELTELTDEHVVDGEDGHHLERVRRLEPHEIVTMADGRGAWRCYSVAETGPGWLRLAAVGSSCVEPALLPRLAVAFALTKAEKPELVVQKLTELGVDRIVPVVPGAPFRVGGVVARARVWSVCGAWRARRPRSRAAHGSWWWARSVASSPGSARSWARRLGSGSGPTSCGRRPRRWPPPPFWPCGVRKREPQWAPERGGGRAGGRAVRAQMPRPVDPFGILPFGRGLLGAVVSMSGTHVGERLRAIRRQKGLSLHDVEARSGLEFKASVLGAYERGERAISVPRLLRLSEIYEVPADQLLPRDADLEINLTDGGGELEEAFTIDLVRLHSLDDPEAAVLSRYASTIQLQRQDFNGRLLTIRRDDLRVLAAVLGRKPDELGARLGELGLRARA